MTAAQRRAVKTEVLAEKRDKMANIVEAFINGKVKRAIEMTEFDGVNVEVPIEAYSNTDQFYTLCKDALEPLGYTAERSHDGGGMYDTLYVSWKKLKKNGSKS